MNDLPKAVEAFQAGLKAGLSTVTERATETKGSLFQTGIRPLIDSHLLEESRKLRDYGDYWSASSSGYCMRRLIFERLGVPKIEQEDEARKQRVFTAGHVFHEWIQKITKDTGLSIAQELELQDEDLMVRGHIDDLVLIDGKLILYDYKSVNSRAFIWAKKNGNKISHYHRMQVGTYMYMLRNMDKDIEKSKSGLSFSNHIIGNNFSTENLTEARILKIEKENLMMMEQQLLWSPELEKDVVGYWKTLNAYWKTRKIPACTCDKYEGGFLAKEKFNPYFFSGKPCSIEYYESVKDKLKEKI